MTEFHYTKLIRSEATRRWTEDLYPSLSEKGKLFLDVTRVHQQDLLAREGAWETPFDVTPHSSTLMPKYDPAFSLSFGDVMDARAAELVDKPLAIQWSGGIDSTAMLVALLRTGRSNLSNITVVTSPAGIQENPLFFEIIKHKFLFASSTATLDDLVDYGCVPVVGDSGDSLFGTMSCTRFFSSYDHLVSLCAPRDRASLSNLGKSLLDVDYLEVKDPIILHLGKGDTRVGRYLYDMIDANIDSVPVPVYTVPDFFWWLIFNVRETECVLRQALLNTRGDDKRKVLASTVNWYCTDDFQKWSMVNNNNGQKISGLLPAQYKTAARDYIHSYDRNRWYHRFKPKYGSLGVLLADNRLGTEDIFGLDTDLRVRRYDEEDIVKYVDERLRAF